MGVMVGRRAVSSGLTGYGTSAFPRVPVPSEAQYNWTMVHAIARQESQFDHISRHDPPRHRTVHDLIVVLHLEIGRSRIINILGGEEETLVASLDDCAVNQIGRAHV